MMRTISNQLHNRYATALCLALVIMTLWHYWHTLALFLLNAPDGDDYVDILWFFEIFLDARDPAGKIQALFLPIHEHITVGSHLLYLADYAVFGKIDFTHYIFIGQLIILGICLVLASALPRQLPALVRFTIALLLYLNLSYWHSSLWAMTSISNQLVILFALLAAISFQHNPNNVWLPVALAIVGCFSQANGLAIFPGIIGTMIASDWQTQRRTVLHKSLLLALPFFLILGFHFFYQNPFQFIHHLDHQAMTTEPELIHLYQRDVSNTSGLTFSITNALDSYFVVSGASVFNKSQHLPAFGVSLLIYGFWLFVLLTKRNIDRFTQIALIFTCISIAMIAIGRGALQADVAAMQSRYRMYSFLLLALTAHQMLKLTACRLSVIGAILLTAVILQVASRTVWNDMANNNQMLVSSYYNWLIDGGFGRTTMSIYPPNQDRRLFIAYNQGRYNPIDAIPARHKPVAIAALPAADTACTSPTTEPLGQIQSYSKKPKAKANELTIQLTAPAWQPEKPAEIILCSNENLLSIQLDAHNFNAEQKQLWPIIALKTQVLPGTYAAYFRQENVRGALGNIAIK